MPKPKIPNSQSPLGPGLRFDLSPERPELEIARLLLDRQGAERALTIEGIAQELWRDEWWFVKEKNGFAVYPHRTNIQRAIKQAVRNLRRAGKKIGSCRGSKQTPAGYYMISNARELALTVAPMLRQAVDELRTVEALTGENYYTRELAGQQKLFTGDLNG